jgi:hypothetical protein
MLKNFVSPDWSITDKVQSVMCACQYARTAEDYVRQFTRATAAAMQSPHVAWVNWPGLPLSLVTRTEGSEHLLAVLPELAGQAPVICPSAGRAAECIAVVPVLFRSSVTGLLAVAGRVEGYTTRDLDTLIEIARGAILEYENLRYATSVGIARAPQKLAHLIHDLRQPLGAVEAHAFYLGLILPDDPDVCEHLGEIQTQIDWASRILDEGTVGYVASGPRPRPAGDTGENVDKRFRTKSAISMVTK